MSTELENKLITAKSIKTVYDDIDNAKMDKENPEGIGSFSLNRKSNSTVGTNSVAIGNNTIASGVSSVAMGDSTKATGDYSFAMGYNSEASGIGSIAIGYDDKILNKVVASGKNSIAMGEDARATTDGAIAIGDATASGEQSVAIGSLAKSSGGESVAIGRGTASGENAIAIGSGEAIGNYSHACGNGIAIGERSYAEGFYTVASGYGSHAEGHNHVDTVTLTGGANSTTYTCSNINYCKIGYYVRYENEIVKIVGIDVDNGIITTDKTLSSESINHSCKILHSNGASGSYSHSEGDSTAASGDYGSHAEGYYTTASGDSSHAEGYDTTAFGSSSHAEGSSTAASGVISHAEGNNTRAIGAASHAEGQNAQASGDVSHAEGNGTIAIGWCQHVQGKHNIQDGKYAHIVGNGTSSKRSNAHTIDWDGNAWFAGDVYVGSTNGIDKDSGSNKLLSTEDIVNSLESDSTTQPLSAAQGKALKTAINSITTDLGNLGGGDMMKATYDTNNSGVVDNAERLNGQSASYYATANSVSNLTTKYNTLESQFSNYLPISGTGTIIPANSNLNTFTTPGAYYSEDNAKSKTLSNTPVTNSGFKLFVIEGYIARRVSQIIMPNSSALWYRQYNEESWSSWINISGTIPVSRGGTGHNFSDIPAGAIIRNSSDDTGLWYTTTADGALYATASNTNPKFGTLPIAQGGTGATDKATALSNLGLTATAKELNVLDGITATTAELNYTDGVTSNIQTQLNSKASSTHEHSTSDITSGTLSSNRLPTIPITKGGTGATDKATARDNLQVAKGSKISKTTAAKAGWYRVAQSIKGVNDCVGIFEIIGAVSGNHTTAVITASTSYGRNPSIQALQVSQFSTAALSKARIVYTGSYENNYAYLEVYNPYDKAITITANIIGESNWVLVDPSTRGSIPSGHSSIEIPLTSDAITAKAFIGSGANLTSLNASNISSGTLPLARGGTGATTAAGVLTSLGINATASELNRLDGITATTAELNYTDGVTSNIQTQLNSKLAKNNSTAKALTVDGLFLISPDDENKTWTMYGPNAPTSGFDAKVGRIYFQTID